MTTLDEWEQRTAQLPNGRLILESGWVLAGFGITRDSDPLEQSNYGAAMREALALAGSSWTEVADLGAPWRDDDDDEGQCPIAVAHFGHFAVGWIDELVVRRERVDLRTLINDLRTYVDEQYPVLDEQDYSEREWKENHPEADGYCYSDDDDCECGREKA
jgi:hypothetical protein